MHKKMITIYLREQATMSTSVCGRVVPEDLRTRKAID